jgi:5-methylcytosine-specific restriction endonuclease McrA
MPPPLVSTEDIVSAYRETGSVWKAGKKVGLAGQTVHERLVSIGYPMRGRKWTSGEVAELRSLIDSCLPMSEIAQRLGRPFGSVAVKASQLGLRVRRQPATVIPRGAGYDKQAMTKHLKALESYSGSLTQYVRSVGLHVDPFVKAMQRHFPQWWGSYVVNHSDFPVKSCQYCKRKFIPMSARQQFCNRNCASDSRADRSYFGGNRRQAVGLAAGVCQLCGVQKKRGLSVHHIFGKESDLGDKFLIALCPGCHQIVTHLSGRKFIEAPEKWEALIGLAHARKHGGVPGGKPGTSLYVEVQIEVWDDEEESS